MDVLITFLVAIFVFTVFVGYHFNVLWLIMSIGVIALIFGYVFFEDKGKP